MQHLRFHNQRGSLVITQVAFLLLLGLVFILAYPAVRQSLSQGVERDKCSIGSGHAGGVNENDLANRNFSTADFCAESTPSAGNRTTTIPGDAW